MSLGATFYFQDCPTCGRRLRVCVEYLGKRIECRHCRGEFVAQDPSCRSSAVDPQDALLRRIEQLLATPEVVDPAPIS